MTEDQKQMIEFSQQLYGSINKVPVSDKEACTVIKNVLMKAIEKETKVMAMPDDLDPHKKLVKVYMPDVEKLLETIMFELGERSEFTNTKP